MKLGTSLRFLYPTGAHTHTLFKEMLAAMPPGGFIERPLGATDTGEQARNVLEIAAAARAAEQLHSYRALGFEFVMVRHIVGEHDAMLRSFERIGQFLMPAIRSL